MALRLSPTWSCRWARRVLCLLCTHIDLSCIEHGSRCWREWGEWAARAKAVRTALYARLEQHNHEFPHNVIDITEETYAKTPSFFERSCGQKEVTDKLAYMPLQAKVYSSSVYTKFEGVRMKISKGDDCALPELIKKINALGEGFVEAAPVMPAPPKPPAS